MSKKMEQYVAAYWTKLDPEAPTLRADFFRAWLLRLAFDFKLKQAREALQNSANGRCCIGVACHLLNIPKRKKTTYYDFLFPGNGKPGVYRSVGSFNGDIETWLNIKTSLFIDLNDQDKLNFYEIALCVITKPEKYIKKLSPEERRYIIDTSILIPSRDWYMTQRKELYSRKAD